MLENIQFNTNSEIDLSLIVLNLFCAFIVSLLIKFHYKKCSTTLTNRDDFSNLFPFITLTIVLVIYIVKSSLALSLGLVGALSIVRFRAAIKEPEELVYLFFIISIGLANGANQFLLSTISTLIIIFFLFLRNFYQSKKSIDFKFNSDSNILSINIINNKKKNIEDVIKQLNPQLKYLKLKSANIEKNQSTYVFWYDLDDKQINSFLNNIKKLSDENLELSIYSKTGAYE